LVSDKLSTNVYVRSTSFAEIMASNGGLSSGMLTVFWYFHFPGKRCSQEFSDTDFILNQISTANVNFEAAKRLGNMTNNIEI